MKHPNQSTQDILSDSYTPDWLVEIRVEIPDYEPCSICGFDHEYEAVEAYRYHGSFGPNRHQG